MGRRNLYDILADIGLIPNKEYSTLHHLFMDEKCALLGGQQRTLCDFIDATYFRELPIRGTSTSVKELLHRLSYVRYESDMERLLVFCEFLIAILKKEKMARYPTVWVQAETIMNNIHVIMELSNHTLYEIDDNRTIIVEKNPKATQAALLITDPNVSTSILEYNHFSIKGQLKEKRNILVSIGHFIEPILNAKSLQTAGYGKLESDAGFLLNKLHIRHNNKEGTKAQPYVMQICDDELEMWYDKAYNTLLSVIIIYEQIGIEAEIKSLKQNYAWI